jgi:chemotaxis protein MotB
MKRKHEASHESHERWLVSYADFITLLFAFFVVMFAASQADKNKAKEVSESVKEALEHGQLSSAIAAILNRKHDKPLEPKSETPPPKPSSPGQPADLTKSLAALQHGLEAELKSGKIGLRLEPRGLVISLREATFFASGDDAVAIGSVPILAKICAELQKFDNPVRLEGHTDSVPIHTIRFRSNWELSAARSIAMLELLQLKFGIEPERLAVAGYAENAPVDTNDSEEGRAHNRRVDLVILSAEALKSEPAPAMPAPSPPAAKQGH